MQSDSSDNERQLREQLDNVQRNERELERDLRSQLDDVRREGRDIERDLRAQLDAAGRNESSRSVTRSDSTNGEWRSRYEALEKELAEQRQTTEEVRRDAAQSLSEMQALSQQSAETLEKEERLLDSLSALEREVRDWKSRYAKVKSQNRSLRASSLGLPGNNGDAAQYARDSTFVSPDGLVKDFHLTNYQVAIDELLQLARRPDSEALIGGMKQVVICVRQISADIEVAVSAPVSGIDGSSSDSAKEPARLRAKLSQTANNLITTSKAHAAAAGLAPVSLLDAAASHLTVAVVDVVRELKIRPTPPEELEREEYEERVAKPAPLNTRGKTPTLISEPSLSTGKLNGLNGHARNRSSRSSNLSSGGYSAYSRYSRYSSNMSPARDAMANGDANGKGLGITSAMGMLRESGIEEFKVRVFALDYQTLRLTPSIELS
jgi:hypothetical protein